jgi:hypothetical protein
MGFAYLDAGSGSMIASMLVGGVGGIAVAARSYKARLGGKFRRKQDEPSVEDTPVETDA